MAAVLGALLAAGAVTTSIALGLVTIERAKSFRPAPLVGQALLLVGSAAAEELIFRVLLIALFTRVVNDPIAVAVAAVLFGLPHVVRGKTNEEQRANAITSTAFGLVTGWMWVSQRDFIAIVAFHAAFNITAGLFLGGGEVDPLSERLPKVTWPLAMRDRGLRTGAALMWCTALSELIPLGVIALLLGPAGLV